MQSYRSNQLHPMSPQLLSLVRCELRTTCISLSQDVSNTEPQLRARENINQTTMNSHLKILHQYGLRLSLYEYSLSNAIDLVKRHLPIVIVMQERCNIADTDSHEANENELISSMSSKRITARRVRTKETIPPGLPNLSSRAVDCQSMSLCLSRYNSTLVP